MNVFMGYNPTVAKQVKVSVWVKEIDGAEPILPAAPKDGDCFIVFDTDDDVLADNPSLKKSYANGSWGDAGGGGVSFPTFTKTGESWTCDMTYEEVESVYSNEALGAPVPTCPCVCHGSDYVDWGAMEHITKEEIDGTGVEFNPALPETIIGGYSVRYVNNSSPFGLYANDGNFYVAAM